MTYEEAIEQLRLNVSPLPDVHPDYWNDTYEAIEMAIEALEKQVPMKPQITHHIYIVDGKEEGYELTHCKNCFHDFGYFDSLVDKGTKWCRRCGQAIDWSEL